MFPRLRLLREREETLNGRRAKLFESTRSPLRLLHQPPVVATSGSLQTREPYGSLLRISVFARLRPFLAQRRAISIVYSSILKRIVIINCVYGLT